MKIYNTLSRKVEEFAPLKPNIVTFYTCGPTVYDYAHIGNLRTYVNNDLIKRSLEYIGFKVKHVMNITDVGHLTGDDDTGEDKIEKGAKKLQKSPTEISKFFTNYFFSATKKLNILPPNITAPATKHIKEIVSAIEILSKKGHTYQTDQAIYFDISTFPSYGKLSSQNLEDKMVAVRPEVIEDTQKKNPSDFALWFFRKGRFANHILYWESPWGYGFPGWHIECSTIAQLYLGPTIDIHTGGIDHIPVHHENEIAQAESITGKQFVRFWIHHNHLFINGEKMSKSKGNFFTIEDIEKKGLNPIALRYAFLQTHYRQKINLTDKSLIASNKAYSKLIQHVSELKKDLKSQKIDLKDKIKESEQFKESFSSAISNDFQIPKALSILWKVLKSNIPPQNKLYLVLKFDNVLGLGLKFTKDEKIPKEIIDMAKKRQEARKKNNFAVADEIRKKIEEKGYLIKDTPKGFCITKKIL